MFDKKKKAGDKAVNAAVSETVAENAKAAENAEIVAENGKDAAVSKIIAENGRTATATGNSAADNNRSVENTGSAENQNQETSKSSETQEDTNTPMVLAENLVKIYKTSDIEVLALQGLDLKVERGELTAIIGNSGSGKSTFLNMLGCLDEPSAGKLYVDGRNLFKLNQKEKDLYKRSTVGFVWQNNGRNLLPYMTAFENIVTPMLLTDVSEKEREKTAAELLDLVGMSHRRNSRLSQLSGGEQQRIAIAIALANRPKLLLADEPTGSVDRKTADYIFDVFRHLNSEYGQTIIIVTHDVELSKKVNRVVAIRDGKISSERILKEKYTNAFGTGKVNWMEEDTQEEYSIIDRAGRLQIPRHMLDELALKDNKILVSMEKEKIILSAPEGNKAEE